MKFIVHCTHIGRAKLDQMTQTVSSYEEGDKLRESWLRKGAARVEVRPVDQTRDWNNRSDPAVREADREEKALDRDD